MIWELARLWPRIDELASRWSNSNQEIIAYERSCISETFFILPCSRPFIKTTLSKYSKKEIFGWTFYDWANSVYSLVISTALFPVYYNAVTTSDSGDKVLFFGHEFTNTVLYSYTLSLSFLILVILSPILSGIADEANRKKSFMQIFCYVGAAGCASLFFFEGPGTLAIGLLGTLLASVGFWGSQVFYNSFLPIIAPRRMQDRVSARGFSLGYLGSSLLLIFGLVVISYAEEIGFADTGQATRMVFLVVAIWWAGFAQITFRRLREKKKPMDLSFGVIASGYRRLSKVVKDLKGRSRLINFLIAFFLFSVGVQTIILLSAVFGSKELGLDPSMLIVLVLVIQFVGMAGATLFARLSERIGNLSALQIATAIWAAICVIAFLLHESTPHGLYLFMATGALVGLVMGGIQALSRSTFSKLLPEGVETTTWFSFYDVTEKVAIVTGTFVYGYVEDLTGSMNYSALSMSVFFIASMIFLGRSRRR